MKKIIVIVLFLGIILSAFATKKYSKKEIDKITNGIDDNSSLRLQTLNANEVYENSFDGGGEIHILWKKEEINKIYQKIGLSYGSLSITFYFQNNQIIKIIEIEENFEFKEGMTLNYDKLTKVFEEEIYVLDYENEVLEVYTVGKRRVSDDVCGFGEYDSTADFIKEKIKQ